MTDLRAELRSQVNHVEEAYEYFLAYAAQGLESDGGGGAGGEIRDWLQRMAHALDAIPGLLGGLLENEAAEPLADFQAFHALVRVDAGKALTSVKLVASQPVVSSQLVDNLNASVHLRTLLTDLFLLDELLSLQGAVTPAKD